MVACLIMLRSRRRWTQSVVVTLALGSGCDKGDDGPTKNPPGPTGVQGAEGGEAGAKKGGDDDEWKSTERIEKEADGTCTLYVSVRCPEGVMCNPPPPETVPCPEDLGGPGTPPAQDGAQPGKDAKAPGEPPAEAPVEP